jgi:uncharacterized protein (DUF433 family)
MVQSTTWTPCLPASQLTQTSVTVSHAYPVENLLELLSSGMTINEILADYEDLERDDLLAALAFATKLSKTKSLQPVGP